MAAVAVRGATRNRIERQSPRREVANAAVVGRAAGSLTYRQGPGRGAATAAAAVRDAPRNSNNTITFPNLQIDEKWKSLLVDATCTEQRWNAPFGAWKTRTESLE